MAAANPCVQFTVRCSLLRGGRGIDVATRRPRRNCDLLFLHARSWAATGLGRAAESGVVTASCASMLKFGDVAFGVANDCQSGITAGARVSADHFGGLAVRHQKPRTLCVLLHAGVHNDAGAFLSMKISEDVRKYVEEQGLAQEEVLKMG